MNLKILCTVENKNEQRIGTTNEAKIERDF